MAETHQEDPVKKAAQPAAAPAAAPPSLTDIDDGTRNAKASQAAVKKRQAPIEIFIRAIVKGAKSVTLYKDGHAMVAQIVSRVQQLFAGARGREHTLTLDTKAKAVLFEDEPLEETPEVMAFAQALHTLGIGQVTFSDRLKDDGMQEFMRILAMKPDDRTPLLALQKMLNEVKIDGVQMVSIISFVETEETSTQEPGELTEEQVTAFVKAATIPDFLYLLFKQNEPISSKEGAALTNLYDAALNREISLEEFQQKAPWKAYDPRIRKRFDELLKSIRNREKWDTVGLLSELSSFDETNIAFFNSQDDHDAPSAFRFAVDRVHAILEKPVGEKQPKYALYAYARLLADQGRAGDLENLIQEYERWRRMAGDSKWASYLATLKDDVQKRVPSRALSKKIAERVASTEPATDAYIDMRDFALTLGDKIVPMLLEDLRGVTEKTARRNLSTLLAQICEQHLDSKPLVDALADEDYFHVIGAAAILVEMKHPKAVEMIARLLHYKHAKVRHSAVQTLRRLGGDVAVDALTSYIIAAKEPAECKLAVTAMSLIPGKKVGLKLIEIYWKNDDYDIRVAIVTAIGRHASKKAEEFLTPITKWNWIEWLTRRNKELRQAARASLHQVREELKSHGA